MSSLVSVEGKVRQLRLRCVLCVHVIFLRHRARGHVAFEFAYERDPDKIDSVLAAWGLTAIAKLDRPSAPLSPLAQTKCLIVSGQRVGTHRIRRDRSSGAAPLGDGPARFPECRRHPPRVRHRRGGRVAGGARAAFDKAGAEGSSFFTVGHSLGGALAVVAAGFAVERPAAPSAASTRSGCRGSARATLPTATTARSAKGRSGSSTATISFRAFRSPHSASDTLGDC